MFIVVYDPPAADALVGFLSNQGYRAWKRTAFVVQIDGSADEANVERVVVEWAERHEDVPLELISRSRIRNLARA